MSDGYLPMPDTEHPAYAHHADAVRPALDRLSVIEIYEPIASSAARFLSPDDHILTSSEAPKRRRLVVKKCAGPAPFVGDARMEQGWYVWRVGVDDLGRHIAGSARLVVRLTAPWPIRDTSA